MRPLRGRCHCPQLRLPRRAAQPADALRARGAVAGTHKLQIWRSTRRTASCPKFGGLVTPPIKLRAHSFLSDGRTHRSIRDGVVDVRVVPSGEARAEGQGGGGPHTLTRGAANDEVKAQLASVEGARVLRLSDAEGVFGGWTSNRDQSRLFHTLMDYYVHRGAWCCSSRNQARQDDGRVYVRPPPPLKHVL